MVVHRGVRHTRPWFSGGDMAGHKRHLAFPNRAADETVGQYRCPVSETSVIGEISRPRVQLLVVSFLNTSIVSYIVCSWPSCSGLRNHSETNVGCIVS